MEAMNGLSIRVPTQYTFADYQQLQRISPMGSGLTLQWTSDAYPGGEQWGLWQAGVCLSSVWKITVSRVLILPGKVLLKEKLNK